MDARPFPAHRDERRGWPFRRPATRRPALRGFRLPAAGLVLGVLAAAAALVALALSRPRVRPRRTAADGPSPDVRETVRKIDNGLAAASGYCELAKIKGESGAALGRRMEAAIETLDEVASLVCRLRRSR